MKTKVRVIFDLIKKDGIVVTCKQQAVQATSASPSDKIINKILDLRFSSLLPLLKTNKECMKD